MKTIKRKKMVINHQWESGIIKKNQMKDGEEDEKLYSYEDEHGDLRTMKEEQFA